MRGSRRRAPPGEASSTEVGVVEEEPGPAREERAAEAGKEEELRALEAALRAPIGAVVAELGLGARVAGGLTRHAAAVLRTNRFLNLTRLTDPLEVAHAQVEDSLRVGMALEISGASVLDLGSGAGYPGVPIAYLEPSARVCVGDARRKKARFLEEVLAELGRGNLRARWGRGEQILAEERFDVVVARAVGPVAKVLALLRPVRHRFGLLALPKGPRLEQELEDARPLLRPRLFRLVGLEGYELGPAGKGGRREVAFFRAEGGAPRRRG